MGLGVFTFLLDGDVITSFSSLSVYLLAPSSSNFAPKIATGAPEIIILDALKES
jgi:hypothetical protein